MLPAIAAALVAGGVVFAMFVVWRRDMLAGRRTIARRGFGPAVALVLFAWLGALGWTMNRGRQPHVRTPVGAGTLAFGVELSIVFAAFSSRLTRRGRSAPGDGSAGRTHHATDPIEVWHVTGDKLDYYIARCECGWTGRAFDSVQPNAADSALAEAHGHGANVIPKVVDIST